MPRTKPLFARRLFLVNAAQVVSLAAGLDVTLEQGAALETTETVFVPTLLDFLRSTGTGKTCSLVFSGRTDALFLGRLDADEPGAIFCLAKAPGLDFAEFLKLIVESLKRKVRVFAVILNCPSYYHSCEVFD